MLPQTGIKEVLKFFKISKQVTRGKPASRINSRMTKFSRGIFQEDSLLPLLFAIAKLQLNHLLRRLQFYKIVDKDKQLHVSGYLSKMKKNYTLLCKL